MTKSKIKAVMFDLDGTIVDTEGIRQNYWIKSFEHFGYKMTKKQCLNLRSLGRPFVIDYLYNLYGPDINYWDIRKYRNQLMDAYYKKHPIKIKKGIEPLLKWLNDNNIKVVLTTANVVDKSIEYLKRVKLYKYFDEIVSASDVVNGKPLPDTYLLACKKTHLKPKDCIGVEDSPNGVISAYKAGLNTVMIPDLTKPDKNLLKLDIKVVKDGLELIDYIKSLNK